MTYRRRIVRVPASSANLGPGFDVLAAALQLELELEVCEVDSFSVDVGGDPLPEDESNLCVRAFADLHATDGIRFEIRNEIPLARGLGSSAAAIVAGMMAADHLYELGLSKDDIYRRAAAMEGHPDNVAAALYGGFVVCPRPEGELLPAPMRLDPPEGIEAIVVIPAQDVPTAGAREALPPHVSLGDAVDNVAAASQLVLGIERADISLIGRGLADRLHQPHRRPLYERSMDLVERASGLGAIGATISGAGPTVLVWCFWQDTGKVTAALSAEVGDWAEVRRVPFSPLGADVPEL